MKTKFLEQVGTGRRYVATPELMKRSDMRMVLDDDIEVVTDAKFGTNDQEPDISNVESIAGDPNAGQTAGADANTGDANATQTETGTENVEPESTDTETVIDAETETGTGDTATVETDSSNDNANEESGGMDLSEMTKDQLITMAADYGVTLNKRSGKDTLVAEVEKLIAG